METNNESKYSEVRFVCACVFVRIRVSVNIIRMCVQSSVAACPLYQYVWVNIFSILSFKSSICFYLRSKYHTIQGEVDIIDNDLKNISLEVPTAIHFQ